MDRLTNHALVVARVLISVVFILNSVGIIYQTISAKELMERGAPVSMVQAAGFALALGIVLRVLANGLT